MSDHGWGGGEWPDDLDPDSGGDLGPDTTPDLGSDYTAGLGGDLGPEPGDAETADLGGFDHGGAHDPLADGPPELDPAPDPPLDPAGDSTVDGGAGLEHAAFDAQGGDLDAQDPDTGGGPFDGGGGGGGDGPFDGGGDGLDGDPGDDGGDEPADSGPELTPVGADPDLDAHADTWTDQSFPEPLDLDAPEPVDGFPWTDPTTLGAAPLPDADAAYQGGPAATELAAYAGEDLPAGADPWTALSASEDPATSSLARWWSPDT
ncbi:hypothetical protein ACTMTJ_12690 [Phytohabitans sp. LJ34]|uniref:hypothetical protein n=1 Tax=Phytohabitans sp. LJ34 TaxID=3452217 RepID=UPI003F8A13C4